MNYGYTHGTIVKILKKFGLKRDVEPTSRIYDLNENIFKKINSRLTAQFLGLIYSDGTMSKINKIISIRLREDDADYLEKWRTSFLKTTRPLFYVKPRGKFISPLNNKTYESKLGTCCLEISSHIIYKDLWSLGLRPNKSKLNLQMPVIDDKYKFDFIRGLFEGDGSICFSETHRCFSIAGQENMIQSVFDIFESHGLNPSLSKTKHICVVRVLRWESLSKLYKLLYKGSRLNMERKRKKFLKMLKTRKNVSSNWFKFE